MLEELSLVFYKAAKEKSLDYLIKYPIDMPEDFEGDPGRIRQVLTNIIGNAIKFTSDGYILIEVIVKKLLSDVYQLDINIHDTGVGMTEQQIENVFGAFTQADASTTRKFGGTGLGLIISKQLTEMMGGEIWLNSQVGQGTTFYFTVEIKKQSKQPSLDYPKLDELQKLNILVVDDNEVSRTILGKMLNNFGIAHELADAGKTALTLIEQHDQDKPYHVVIMDWKMTDIDGVEATKILQHHPSLKQTPKVILISAFHQNTTKIGYNNKSATSLISIRAII